MSSSLSPKHLGAFTDLALDLKALHCVVVSAAGGVVFASAAVASTTRRRAPEIPGVPFSDLLASDDHAEAARLIATALKVHQPASAPLALTAPDGTAHLLAFTARRIDDEVLLVGEPLQSRVARSDPEDRAYWHLRRADDVLQVCMDCQEVRPGDRWVDVQVFMSANDLSLSHGLCPGCFDERERGLDSRAETPDGPGSRV